MMPLLQFISRVFINTCMLRGSIYLRMTLGKHICNDYYINMHNLLQLLISFFKPESAVIMLVYVLPCAYHTLLSHGLGCISYSRQRALLPF